jgi:hypothetical protein
MNGEVKNILSERSESKDVITVDTAPLAVR